MKAGNGLAAVREDETSINQCLPQGGCEGAGSRVIPESEEL